MNNTFESYERYVVDLKDCSYFFAWHTSDNLTFLTKNPEKSSILDDVPDDFIKNIIKNTGKFIDIDGLETELPYDQIVGIKAGINDFTVFRYIVKHILEDVND